MHLHWPIPTAPGKEPAISQLFGGHANPYPGYLGHMGVDFPAPMGSPDLACHDSTIIEAKLRTDGYGYDTIEEFEEDGFTWRVLHGHHHVNEDVVGQKVRARDEIAKVGTSGYSTGPHVHLGLQQWKDGVLLNQDNGYHGWIDPLPYFRNKDTSMHLAKDNGTVYLVSGINQKTKLGISDPETEALFGDEPIVDEDTSSIPQGYTLAKGFIINKH